MPCFLLHTYSFAESHSKVKNWPSISEIKYLISKIRELDKKVKKTVEAKENQRIIEYTRSHLR